MLKTILFVGLLCATSVAAQQTALPRLPNVLASQFPAIGRLGLAGFRERQGCTATLIAPNLVLTAAHCVSPSGHSARVFVAGWSRGDYIAARKTILELRHPGYAPDGKHSPRNDVALVVLNSPITDVTPFPLGKVAAASLYGTRAALIGYHSRTPHLLSGSFTCLLGRFNPGLLQVGCPVISGNSGGPILTQDAAGNWQVVGVVSSKSDAGAIAVELPDWLRTEVEARRKP